MHFSNWLEATNEFVHKIIDPALLTFREYLKVVDPKNKRHPEEAYDVSLQQLQRDYNSKTVFNNLLYRKLINGILFEFRFSKKDLHQLKYAKTDADGEIVRINGEAQYFTPEELQRKGVKKEQYEFAVFDKDKVVGVTQDEWGTLLVMVAREYRQFGIGTMLFKLALEKEPDRDSGGFTNKGFNTFKKVHSLFVKEYLQKGFYSYLIQNGKITLEKVKEILKSANIENKKHKEVDLNTNNPANWLLFNDNGTFIIYDKKLKDLYQEEDDYWQEIAIKGVGDVGPASNNNYRLRTFGGENNEVKKLIMYACVSWAAEEDNKPLIVYNEDLPFVNQQIMKIDKKQNQIYALVSLLEKPFDYKQLKKQEKLFRKTFDVHDEFYHSLINLSITKYHVDN